MTPEQARLKKVEDKIRANPLTAVCYLQIADKKSKKVFLTPNRPQRYLLKHLEKYRRVYCLKFRQAGFSTMIQARNFLRTALFANVDTVLVAQDKETTSRMLKVTQQYLNWMPESFPPALVPKIGQHGRQSRNEIFFEELNSSIFIGTQGSDAFGRGTKINNLHLSELSSYKGENVTELIAGLEEAVPPDGTIVVETTPRGIGNIAHQMWVDDMNGYFKLFIPWWYMEEYTLEEEEFNKLTLDKIPYPTVDNLTSEEKDVIRKALLDDKIEVTLGQIAFRRWKKATRGRFFYQEYPEDPITCFLVAESDIFTSEIIGELIRTIDSTVVLSLQDGHIKIYKEPIPNHAYVFGVDCSEGDPNSDFASTTVMDVETGEQVASMHGRWIDYVQAEKNVTLARYYNNALLAVERNNHGHSVLNSILHTEHYDNVYYAEDGKPGWVTSSRTKPLMITGADGLVQAIEKGHFKVHEPELLGECLTFEYKPGTKQGGMGAREKCFDDRVMSAAVCWQARLQAMVMRDPAGNRVMVA